MSRPPRSVTRVACVLMPAALCAVYAWLTPAASGMGDASELTLVLATGGVPHPTGYPLYVLTGHLFCLALHGLGMGWSRAAALWSAVGAAVGLGYLIALGHRLGTPPEREVEGTPETRALGLLATLVPVSLFALQPIMMAEATRAEINSWSVAWVCAAGWLFVRLSDRAAAAGPAVREAAGWGLMCGLGLAHHLTSILISVPLSVALIVVWIRARRFAAATAVAGLGAALIPLASYGFIAWHAWHPATAQWELLDPTPASVIAHITGEQYRHFVGYFAPSAAQRELLATVAYPFVLAGLLLMLVGLSRARAERKLAWSALFVACLLVLGFTFRYGVDDPAPYFLPVMALGTAAAIAALVALAQRPAGIVALLVLTAVSVFVAVPWIKDGIEERSATMEYEETIRSMWSAIPADTAIVSWADDRYHRLREYQLLRGEKPALLVVTPDLFFAGSMRRTIRDRFGADPLQGFIAPHLTPGAANEQDVITRHRMALVESLNVHIRVPVILFDPGKPIVFQLRKPWEP